MSYTPHGPVCIFSPHNEKKVLKRKGIYIMMSDSRGDQVRILGDEPVNMIRHYG